MCKSYHIKNVRDILELGRGLAGLFWPSYLQNRSLNSLASSATIPLPFFKTWIRQPTLSVWEYYKVNKQDFLPSFDSFAPRCLPTKSG